jgi:hypothetical protein
MRPSMTFSCRSGKGALIHTAQLLEDATGSLWLRPLAGVMMSAGSYDLHMFVVWRLAGARTAAADIGFGHLTDPDLSSGGLVRPADHGSQHWQATPLSDIRNHRRGPVGGAHLDQRLLEIVEVQRVLAELAQQVSGRVISRSAVRGGERPADELIRC